MSSLVLAAKSAYNSVSDVVSAGTWQFRYLLDRILSDSIKAAPDAARSLKQFTGYSFITAGVSMIAASFFKIKECPIPFQKCTTIPAGWFTAAEQICTQPVPVCSEIEPSLTVVMPVVALALGTAYLAGKMFSACLRSAFPQSESALSRVDERANELPHLASAISDSPSRDEEDQYGAGLANIPELNERNSLAGGLYTGAWQGGGFINLCNAGLEGDQSIAANSSDHEGRCGCLSKLWARL